jgi:hypothetical protein
MSSPFDSGELQLTERPSAKGQEFQTFAPEEISN